MARVALADSVKGCPECFAAVADHMQVESDFASSAMVRVLVRGMELMGIEPPAFVTPSNHGATLSLDAKRLVVGSAVEQGGFACLTLLGRGLHDYAQDPTHLALTAGRSARSMFHRWQRLERYIHSRHEVDILDLGQSSALLLHKSRNADTQTLPAEDLVVCGVLCALLEASGLMQVRSEAAGVELYPDPDPVLVAALVSSSQTSTWRICWATEAASDDDTRRCDLWAELRPPLWSSFACEVGAMLALRFPEISSLDYIADQLSCSVREVQRQLALEKLSYRNILAEVRFRLAGWYLIKTLLPIAEIGFICGFSDQAHLTREFNRRVGMTPRKYRADFVVD